MRFQHRLRIRARARCCRRSRMRLIGQRTNTPPQPIPPRPSAAALPNRLQCRAGARRRRTAQRTTQLCNPRSRRRRTALPILRGAHGAIALHATRRNVQPARHRASPRCSQGLRHKRCGSDRVGGPHGMSATPCVLWGRMRNLLAANGAWRSFVREAPRKVRNEPEPEEPSCFQWIAAARLRLLPHAVRAAGLASRNPDEPPGPACPPILRNEPEPAQAALFQEIARGADCFCAPCGPHAYSSSRWPMRFFLVFR